MKSGPRPPELRPPHHMPGAWTDGGCGLGSPCPASCDAVPWVPSLTRSRVVAGHPPARRMVGAYAEWWLFISYMHPVGNEMHRSVQEGLLFPLLKGRGCSLMRTSLKEEVEKLGFINKEVIDLGGSGSYLGIREARWSLQVATASVTCSGTPTELK